MDDIPSISSGSVGSRFVSQSELETAKAQRDKQWKAAYARLGQEPPPQPVEDVFDGRSLAEKLAANKAAKQEEWEQRNKLGNQFRALEEDEVIFLDSVLEKQREEERARQESDGKELQSFREAVAARENAAKPPPVKKATAPSDTAVNAPPKSKPSTATHPPKKDAKKSLKGVLVKKKPKPAAVSSPAGTQKKPKEAHPQTRSIPDDDDKDHPQAKRRKVEGSQ